MKIIENISSLVNQIIPKESFYNRIIPIALIIIASFGALLATIGYLLLTRRPAEVKSQNSPLLPLQNLPLSPQVPAQTPARPSGESSQNAPELTQLFNRVIDAEIASRPKLILGNDYQMLVRQREKLENDFQKTLFYAELLSVCDEEGKLLHDISSDKLKEFAEIFLKRPLEYWGLEIQNLYRSILSEFLCKKYAIHYNEAKSLKSVIFRGQELIIQVVEDKGDCLFLSFISGLTETIPPTVQELRNLASEKLSEEINKPDADEGIIQQCALGMEMHREARSGVVPEYLLRETCDAIGFENFKEQFSEKPELYSCDNEEMFFETWRAQNLPKTDEPVAPKTLALEFCKELVKPGYIYPGEETIKVLADSLKQPTVIMDRDSLRHFGPELSDDIIPIFIYKMPHNAHYNRLVVDLSQWKVLRQYVN